MASTSPTSLVTLKGQKIEGCFLDGAEGYIADGLSYPQPEAQPEHSTDPSALLLPITLSIFFDQTKHNGFFRLYTVVNLQVEGHGHPMPIYLDVAPDQVQSLALGASAARPNSRLLHFRFIVANSISVIAPQALPPGHLQPKSHSDWAKMERLRFLARQPAFCILLPPTAHDIPFAACCEAISAQHLFVTRLRPEPSQIDLRSLYRGKGGRVVSGEERVVQPTYSSSAPDDDPPAYDSDISQPPPTWPSSPATPLAKGKKRARASSTPGSNSSTPNYPVYKHFDLAVGEREKIMAELLRRAEKKEAVISKQLEQAGEVIDRLAGLLTAAKEHGIAPEDCGIVGPTRRPCQAQLHMQGSRPDNTAATPSTLSDEGSVAVASVASDLSDRIQTRIARQISRLRNELEDRGYVTVDSLEDQIYGRFVEIDGLTEAVESIVDERMEQVRERVLSSWL